MHVHVHVPQCLAITPLTTHHPTPAAHQAWASLPCTGSSTRWASRSGLGLGLELGLGVLGLGLGLGLNPDPKPKPNPKQSGEEFVIAAREADALGATLLLG